MFRSLAAALRSAARHRRRGGRRHVDLRQRAAGRDPAKIRRDARPAVAGQAAALDHSPRKRLHRLVRFARWPGAHQPSLRHVVPAGALQHQLRTTSTTVSTPRPAAPRRNARRRSCPVLVEMEDVTAKVNGATAGLADAQANQARKQELSKLEAACTESAKKNRTTGPLGLRIGDAVSGRPIFPIQVSPLRRRAHGVRAAACDRRVRRRSGQLQLPALEPGFQPDARLREGQAGAHAGSSDLASRRSAAGRSDVRRRPSRQHQPPAHRRAAALSARRLGPFLSDSQLRAARPADPVEQDRRRAGPHRQRLHLQSVENSLKVYRGFQTALLDDTLFARKTSQERELREKVSRGREAQQHGRQGVG